MWLKRGTVRSINNISERMWFHLTLVSRFNFPSTLIQEEFLLTLTAAI